MPESNQQADAQVETQVKKDFQNGWHWTLSTILQHLGSACAMIGLDIKDEFNAISAKIEARFKK